MPVPAASAPPAPPLRSDEPPLVIPAAFAHVLGPDIAEEVTTRILERIRARHTSAWTQHAYVQTVFLHLMRDFDAAQS